MPDEQLLRRPATELAALVRAGEVRAAELTELALERIEALDPALGAFVDVDADGALAAAAAAIAPGDRRPLAGVPVAVKGNRAVTGLRLTSGASLPGDARAAHDHNVVRRLRAAGAVVVGTTTMPEYGILPVTEGRRFGPTRNPWDTTRTPGGSSGGSAAAVAGGMVPFAHGNDGGGSIRIPAACCGLVGLKPQRGRISHAPEIGEQFLSQDGVLTRTVAETAALLDVLAGPEPGDSSWAPPPPEAFAASAAREPGRLRIAVTCAPSLEDVPVAPACADAVREAALLLERLGHDVVEADPPWGEPGLLELFGALFGPAVASSVAAAAALAGRAPREEDMEPLSWWVWTRARALDSVSAAIAAVRLQAVAQARRDVGAATSTRSSARRSPRSPCRSARSIPAVPIRRRRSPAAPPSRPSRRSPTSPAHPRSRSRSEPIRAGSRSRIQLIGPPAGEGLAARARSPAGGRGAPAGRARTIGRSQPDRSRRPPMAYVIAEPCIGTKDNSCVEVCPVDCIHPTPDEPDYDKVDQLYIDPEECIDCDACVEACPVDACFAEDQLPSEWAGYSQINSEYFSSR